MFFVVLICSLKVCFFLLFPLMQPVGNGLLLDPLFPKTHWASTTNSNCVSARLRLHTQCVTTVERQTRNPYGKRAVWFLFGHSAAFTTHLTPGDGCHGDGGVGKQEEGRATSHGETCEDTHTYRSALPGRSGALQSFTKCAAQHQRPCCCSSRLFCYQLPSDQAGHPVQSSFLLLLPAVAVASGHAAAGQKVQKCEQEAEAAGKKEQLAQRSN